MCELLTLKPHLSEAEQLGRLRARGLSIYSEQSALQDLARFGYYRLSGYYYPLRKTNPVGIPGRQDDFIEGASLDLVVELADFDKRLRLLALEAVEAVEVAVRVAIAHRLGKLSSQAHLEPRLLDKRFTPEPNGGIKDSAHDAWRLRFADLCEKSKEDFWLHHVERYGGQMPIWVAIELWDFGLLSASLKACSKGIAMPSLRSLPQRSRPVFGSWLRMINFVRNVAAHHSRLWNRTLPDLAKLPPLDKCRLLKPLHENPLSRRKVFAALTCLRLLLRAIHPKSDWHLQVKALVATFPKSAVISVEAAGFAQGWEETEIWR